MTQISDIEPAARRRLFDTPHFASVVPFDGVCNQRNALMRFVVHAIRTGIFQFAPRQAAIGQRLS